jgi:hypothetical protein
MTCRSIRPREHKSRHYCLKELVLAEIQRQTEQAPPADALMSFAFIALELFECIGICKPSGIDVRPTACSIKLIVANDSSCWVTSCLKDKNKGRSQL